MIKKKKGYSEDAPIDTKKRKYLQLHAHIFHIKSRHTHALYPDRLIMLPVIMNIIQHVVC